jgi:metal-responsive CopG/Arc/MetJ family transcriptional regulator
MVSMKNDTHQRINITLPSLTLQHLDRVANHGGRSRLIDAAVNFYLSRQKRTLLRKELREGAVARVTRDRTIATELFGLTDLWEMRQA